MVSKSFSQEHQKSTNNKTVCKSIIICADDFGQSQPISEGIFELLQLQRINATSCLTNTNNFKSAARLLGQLKQTFIGLHLNLTEGSPLTKAGGLHNYNQFISLNKLLIKSQLRLLKPQVIYQELKAQLDQFIHTFGHMPYFLDGHQHIHHLPIIRDVILTLYKEYHLNKNHTFIRSVKLQVDQFSLKSLIIKYTGAQRFAKLLKQQHIPHNLSFGGIYNFNPKDFQESFKHTLANITDNGLIMCHPGYKATDDSLNQSREVELNYFKSDDYIETLKQYNLLLKQP
ncbi:ChbG/HpnK family deacetylase [Thiotrichales bacterium 19S3-7]|nr:ChbG/HpnK family deacetylase [Thiotrichales bacterium 19S3-7]MCF6802176.1 ChbG/HpnK family deacetylase [Thiotrichales bacterium 19S3-11]